MSRVLYQLSYFTKGSYLGLLFIPCILQGIQNESTSIFERLLRLA